MRNLFSSQYEDIGSPIEASNKMSVVSNFNAINLNKRENSAMNNNIVTSEETSKQTCVLIRTSSGIIC